MRPTPQQITYYLDEVGIVSPHSTMRKALRQCANGEQFYVNLEAKEGVSAIIVAPKWMGRQTELLAIPDIVLGSNYYHSSHMVKFPKHIHTGKTPTPYGVAITIESAKGLQELISLLSSSTDAGPALIGSPNTDNAVPDEKIAVNHAALLCWFEQFSGQILTWEQLKSAPATVVTSAKGIYKPASLRYALSIREILDSPYGNQEPKYQNDGSWCYEYPQEENKNGNSAALFTNQGLKYCMDDCVPVAVLKQLSKKPNATRYLLLGLANVVAWENGVFTLQSTTLASQDQAFATQSQAASVGYDPQNVEDHRKRTMREITARQGQPKFRSGLLTAYEGRCAFTGCGITEVLEAAHITPYLGPETNHISNGLLLRSDLHTLWDRGLIYLNDDYTLQLDPRLSTTEYAPLAGTQITLPHPHELKPSLVAIQAHRMWALSER